MKKIIIIHFFSFVLCLPNLFSQQPIITKWYYDLTDTTIKDKVYGRFIRPQDVMEVDSKDILFGTFQFNYGWSVRRLEKNTGKEVWVTRRNAYVPDSTNKMFTYDNLFKREDGNLEVLGVRSKTDAHSPYGDGNPMRVIYDIKTGQEKQIIFVPQKDTSLTNVQKTGVVGSYVPKPNKQGYYMLNYNRFGDICATIKGLDTNLFILDTLTNITVCKDKNNPFLYATSMTGLSKINNHLYFMVSTWAGSTDTSSYGYYMYKVDLEGKPKMIKNVAKDLFYIVGYKEFSKVSDGYIISGEVDTLYKRKPNTLMCTKLDTNGIKQWRALVKLPTGIDSLNIFQIGEDKKRNGYWLMMGAYPSKRDIYLYFIDNKGKITYIRAVKLPLINKKNIVPTGIWVLDDGNLYFSARYLESMSTKIVVNFTLTRIEATVLDDLLKSVKTDDEIKKKEMLMYPNPANQMLNLYFTDAIEGEIFIQNGLGQLCKRIKLDNNEMYNIDLSDLTNGIYYVNIIEKNKIIISEKLIIIN